MILKVSPLALLHFQSVLIVDVKLTKLYIVRVAAVQDSGSLSWQYTL